MHLGTIESAVSCDNLSFKSLLPLFIMAFNLSTLCSLSSINVWLQMLHSSLDRDCLFALLKVDMVPYHSSLSSHLLRYTICTATSLLFYPGFFYSLTACQLAHWGWFLLLFSFFCSANMHDLFDCVTTAKECGLTIPTYQVCLFFNQHSQAVLHSFLNTFAQQSMLPVLQYPFLAFLVK